MTAKKPENIYNIAFGREKGDVAKDEEGVKTARNFGKKMVWLIKRIKGSQQ